MSIPVLPLLALLSAPPQLQDLAFLAGHWKGPGGPTAFEEVWTRPSGDAMIGMFRIVSNGKTRMTEFMAFEQRETGPVLVMRHFGPGLVAREEKDAPLVWSLEKLKPNHAVFWIEQAGTRLDFLRQGDSLTITLEKTQNGKTTRSPFSYTLAAPAP
ncbi:MAG: hypothetical protein C0504_19155 [Candidatus Solibacter sp.]|nr:hypothetical protein [Candidatus Solibacter sp.]